MLIFKLNDDDEKKYKNDNKKIIQIKKGLYSQLNNEQTPYEEQGSEKEIWEMNNCLQIRLITRSGLRQQRMVRHGSIVCIYESSFLPLGNVIRRISFIIIIRLD